MSWSALEIARAVGSPRPTPQQTAVIEAPLEPALVVAGAGSGKTETMAARVVWLVTNGLVRPEEVLGLTFTRKASIELADRLGSRLRAVREAGLWAAGDDDDGFALPTVSTYHAYAGRLVTEHGLRIGVEPETRLLSEAASWQLAGEVVRAYDGDMAEVDKAVSTVTEAVLSVSGELAEHLVAAERAEEFLLDLATRVAGLPGQDHKKPLKVGADTARDLRAMARIYPLVRRYRELKQARGALDFADQMAAAARLARDVPAVGALERQRYGAVLLDEFQDTSEAQMVLLESLFAGHARPVTAVGDPNQSIYGWRGASATTLTRFPARFRTGQATAPVLALSTSWRNAERVLTAANRTARPLREASRVPVERLVPSPGAPSGRIEVARLSTHVQEAAHVAQWVRDRWADAKGDRTGASAAVLCRNRAQFDGVVHALRDLGLPVEVVGLGGLLSAPEVADLVALLTVAQDPTRGDQLMRLLTGPVCRLGAADLDGLWAWARALSGQQDGGADSDPAVLSEALHSPPPETWTGHGGHRVGNVALSRVTGLGRVLDRVRSLVGIPLPDLLAEAERLLGLDIEVAADPDQPAAWARAQLDALGEVAAAFAGSAERATLGGFIDWLEAARERERGLEMAEVAVSSEAVQVLTIHAAKGLEWDAVAVPGLAEAVFPSHPARSRVVDGEWLVPEPGDRGWLTGIGALPYPLRGDADGLPTVPWGSLTDTSHLRSALEEHKAAGGRHQLEEERRLAYVAFTRAREEMLLTAPVWSTGSTPRVTSRFLTELIADPDCPVEITRWDPMPDPTDPAAATNPLLEEETRAPWPVGPDARRIAARDLARAVLDARTGVQGRRAPGSAPPHPDDVDTQLELLLAERDQSRGRRAEPGPGAPEHLSTSALVELSADPVAYWRRQRRPVPTPPAVAARAGTAFHSWVEQHFAAAALVDLEQLPGSADETVAPDLHRLQENFLASPWASRTPHAVEVAVETVLAGVPVRGRIDAVFVDADGRHTVVDWKTGSPGSEQDRERRAVQLATYRVAYSRLAGLPVDQVDAVFFFAATGHTEAPDLLGEPELESLLADLVRVAGQERTPSSVPASGSASSSAPPSAPSSSDGMP